MFRGGEVANLQGEMTLRDRIKNIQIPDILSKLMVGLQNLDPIITSFRCDFVKVGNYWGTNRYTFLNFCPDGIVFQCSSIANGEVKKHVIPIDCVLKIYQCTKLYPYFIVHVDDTIADILKDEIEFNTAQAKFRHYHFDPLSPFLQYKFLTFKLLNSDIEQRVQVMHQFYGNKVVDLSYHVDRECLYLKVAEVPIILPPVEGACQPDDIVEYIRTGEQRAPPTTTVQSTQTSPSIEEEFVASNVPSPMYEDISDVEDQPMEQISQPIEIKKPDRDRIIFTYPRGATPPKLELKVRDLEGFLVGNCLNDTLIDFIIQVFFWESLDPEKRERAHFFSSLFYPSYFRNYSSTEFTFYDRWNDPNQSYMNFIAPWTRDVDLFQKDFILFPICDKNHWLLVAVCYPALVYDIAKKKKRLIAQKIRKNKFPRTPKTLKRDAIKTYFLSDSNSDVDEESQEVVDDTKRPCIIIMDSQQDESRKHIFQIVRTYIQQEWNLRYQSVTFTEESMPGRFLRVTQQINENDCGMYLLNFMANFFNRPLESFQDPLPDKSDWLYQNNVNGLRHVYYLSLVTYVKEYHPGQEKFLPKWNGEL